MHSHIQIPNAVLQNFRDESDREKKVWYLDLSTGEIQKKPARRLGTAKNYYSGTGEAFWSQCIESPLGNLIKKVRSFCEGDSQAISITPNDKEIAMRCSVDRNKRPCRAGVDLPGMRHNPRPRHERRKEYLEGRSASVGVDKTYGRAGHARTDTLGDTV